MKGVCQKMIIETDVMYNPRVFTSWTQKISVYVVYIEEEKSKTLK